jgi:deoxycytidylate deaminase
MTPPSDDPTDLEHAMLEPVGPELVFGLVGALGTDMAVVAEELEVALVSVGYTSKVIQLSALLDGLPHATCQGLPTSGPRDVRYERRMQAGNAIRESLRRNDALAMLAVAEIMDVRQGLTGDESQPATRTAYILRSLRTPEEVQTLRAIYGAAFVLIGAHTPKQQRIEQLTQRIRNSRPLEPTFDAVTSATRLVNRDEAEDGTDWGQNVRDTFQEADVFVDASTTGGLVNCLRRAVELLFGYPFHTPSSDETGMFHAQAAALRSAALGRQVGATISTPRGDIISVGTNEVPRAGGGHYQPGDQPDARDFQQGIDSNDILKRQVLAEVLERLRTADDWLAPSKRQLPLTDLVNEAIAGQSSVLKGARILDIIEFGRAVHAETAALLSAARRGTAVDQMTLFATTFPCHECARNIVAAGIRRVVYISPYPKSRAEELFADSIRVDSSSELDSRVSFVSFVGVAPRMYLQLFTMPTRKYSDGRVREWNGRLSFPRLVDYSASLSINREQDESAEFMVAFSSTFSTQVTEEIRDDESTTLDSPLAARGRSGGPTTDLGAQTGPTNGSAGRPSHSVGRLGQG